MKLHLKSSARKQQGSVLILAVLVVAIVALLSLRFSREYQLGLARAETRWSGSQARAYLAGAERLATYFLAQDDPELDSLMDIWAQEIPPFPIEGGLLYAKIEDATARFNLNNLGAALATDTANNAPERFTEAFQRRFIRLLLTFEDSPLTEEDAIAVVEALVDWMDADNNTTGFNGAEADYYQSLDPPYKPANKAFQSVEELLLVRHMTPEIMQLIRPYVTVLPGANAANNTVASTMNLNTLAPQLLRTINVANSLIPLSESELESIQVDAAEEYTEVSEYTANTAWTSILPQGSVLNMDGLDIKTEYFTVQTYVNLGDQRRGMALLLKRDGASLTTLLRRDLY